MLYNAIQLWLAGLLWKLTPSNTPTMISSAAQIAADQAGTREDIHITPLALPGTSLSLHPLAVEICRVFEYQCRNVQHSKASALFCLLPIGLASSVLDRETRYQEWIRSMLDMSTITKGYAIGQNMMGFGFYLSSAALQESTNKVQNDAI